MLGNSETQVRNDTAATRATAARITAEESESVQRRAAGALLRRNLHPGDRIALVAGSSPEYLAVTMGALRVGIVPVLLNESLLPAEQQDLIGDADPVLVLRDADLPPLCNGPAVELADVPLARPMLYTSGTTGRAKGVWTGVLDEAQARAAILEERDVWHFDPADVHLVVSPLHHSAPLRFAMGTLLAGGSVIVPGSFDAPRLANIIATQRPTTAFMVPAHLQRLFALPEQPPFDCFRLLMHAGAPCPETLKRRAMAVFPKHSVWEFYGSTEGQFTTCGPEDWLQHPGSVGRARKHRELCLDPDGTIWCRVPPYARFEYWRDPKKTAQAWRGDAFTVRDIGRLDADGFLYLDGRRDDLIISGGVNVYPVEVERAILQHPGVSNAAVFPLNDESWGQMVCAAVVGDVDAESLSEWLRERVAPYKRPKRIFCVDTIPVSSTGKVKRSQLAEQLGLLPTARRAG